MEEEKKVRMSDYAPIEITDDMSETEKYVYEEAKLYLDETCFSSIIGYNVHVENVVKLGKQVKPFIIKLISQCLSSSPMGQYTHFCLLVMQELYGNPFKGYVPIDFCMKYWEKTDKKGLLYKTEEETKTEEIVSVLQEISSEYMENNNENKDNENG